MQPFCTCKRAFSPVANLLTHVVSFGVDKTAEERKWSNPIGEEVELLNGMALDEWIGWCRQQIVQVKHKKTRKRKLWRLYFILALRYELTLLLLFNRGNSFVSVKGSGVCNHISGLPISYFAILGIICAPILSLWVLQLSDQQFVWGKYILDGLSI